MVSGIVVIISLIPIVSGAVLIWLGFKAVRRYWLITDTPRSKIRGIAMGLVEIYGWAYAKQYLRAPFSKKECVYYRYEVDELRQQGKTTSWVTVDRGERRNPILVVDQTGEVWVDPAGAEFTVDMRRAYSWRCGSYGGGRLAESFMRWVRGEGPDPKRNHLIPLTRGSSSAWGDALGDRRYYEYCIDPANPVYILGTAMPDRNVKGGVIIRKGVEEPTFLIASKRGWRWADYHMEVEMANPLRMKAAGYIAFGAFIAFLGAYFYFWVWQYTG